MIDQKAALKIAIENINALGLNFKEELCIIESDTVQHDKGWVFFYNSRKYLETGSFLDMLAGNAPIFVSHEGDVHTLPTSDSYEVFLKNL